MWLCQSLNPWYRYLFNTIGILYGYTIVQFINTEFILRSRADWNILYSGFWLRHNTKSRSPTSSSCPMTEVIWLYYNWPIKPFWPPMTISGFATRWQSVFNMETMTFFFSSNMASFWWWLSLSVSYLHIHCIINII